MKKEEIFFMGGIIIGLVFQWSSTFCAFTIGIILGYYGGNNPGGNPVGLVSNLEYKKKNKKNYIETDQKTVEQNTADKQNTVDESLIEKMYNTVSKSTNLLLNTINNANNTNNTNNPIFK